MATYAKEFEQFIISGFREETLNSLVPGSIPERYLSIRRRLNQVEKEIPEKLREDIYKFVDESSSEENLRLRLIYLLTKYDLENTTESEKGEIVEELKNFFIFDKYEFDKPSHYNQNQEQLDETQKKFSSILDEEVFKFDHVIKNMYEKNLQYNDTHIKKELKSHNLPWYIDLTKFSDEMFLEIMTKEGNYLQSCLTQIYLYSNQTELYEKLYRIVRRTDLLQKFSKAKSLFENIHNFMTTDQIGKFVELLPENVNKDVIINELVNRKFSIYLRKAKDNKEKSNILKDIYEYLRDKPLTFNSMRCDILLLILENGIKINEYDKKLFLEYLENPIFYDQYQYRLSQEKIQKISQWNINRQMICNLSYKSDQEEKSIVSKYLRYFFLFEKSSVDEFSEYLQNEMLMREFYIASVLRGVEDENIIKFLSNKAYEDLVNKVEITICENNKDKFNIDSPVLIDVDLKNVTTLFVKIFEINTENYYYNKKQPLNSAISLEGLIATFEDTYSFAEKPQKLIRRTFNFDKIPNKRGIYIIELIGNGYSSRALIKKGGISLIHKWTVNGKTLFILDENQNICKGDSTGAWVKDQFYKSEPGSGAIIIPYQRSASNENVVLVHDNFAEIANLALQTESYKLEGSFILNKESVLMGNVTKVLIRPYLYVNDRLADVTNLKNPKITINLTKIENDQNIPITTTYEGDVLKNQINYEREIEVEFQVPPKLNSINITFQAEIKNRSQEATNALSFSKNITVDSLYSEINKYAQIFLSRNGDDYILQVLGKNGEPKSNVQINFKFEHTMKKIKNDIVLQTDKNGEIKLGKLPGVLMMKATGNYRGNQIKSKFFLNDNVITLPSQMDVLEGSELKLPIGNNSDAMDTFYFKKYDEDTNKILENLNNKHNVKVESFEYASSKPHIFLSIRGLTEGSYKLGWNNSNIEITINVHKGRLWDSSNFIIADNQIIENSEYANPVHIEAFEYVTRQEGDITSQYINLKVNKDAINPRVHLFAYKFLSDVECNSSFSILRNLEKTKYRNKFSIESWKNVYLSNRVLHEEIQYVFDRKQYERFMGNSLEKPSLLVKRQFVRDTTTLIQEVKLGTQYKDEKMEMYNQKSSNIKTKKMKKLSKEEDEEYEDYEERELNYAMIYDEECKELNTFHNFLAFSPLALNNLIPDENGEISVKVDLSNYSIVHALVLDSMSVYEENLYLHNTEIAKRNLTMTNPLDPSKEFSELRKTNCLLKDSKFNIGDITSTSYQIIDSLDKLITFISLTPHFYSIKSEWNNLSFLIKFNEISNNDKLKKFSDFFSHEVNVFLFFKHHEFFLENVKPILKYKSEKTFIDFFLLNDSQKIQEFTIPSRYNNLNAFEQCLLIYSIRKSEPELARIIAKSIKNQADQNKISAEELKRMFTIIINMKMEEKKEEEEEVRPIEAQSEIEPTESRRRFRNTVACCKIAGPEMKSSMPSKMAKGYFEDINISEEELELKNMKNNINRENGKSKEYCETHYYNNHSYSKYKSLVTFNAFFADLADYWVNNSDIPLATNFISSNIILPISTLPQLIFTLAVSDLNPKPVSHQFNRLEGRALEVVPNSNMIIFTKEISEAPSDFKSTLMIAQVVSKSSASEEQQQDTTNSFIINEIYKHETIVTNISNKTLSFELLIQVPEGSIPVDGSEYTRTVNLELSKFKTTKVKMSFYFPLAGEFIQSPPNASIDGVVVAKSQPLTYKVFESLIKTTHSSLDDVLEFGSKKEILEFLAKSEILKIEDISKVHWLLKDKEFYSELLKILRERGLYSGTVWSFSVYHKDIPTFEEYLSNNEAVKKYIGPYANFSLLKVDDSNNFDIMNHKDYHPILNARVHRISQEKNNSILNNELRTTYHEFINYLIGLKEIDAKNYLRLCYYLILQDRIEEALKVYEKINTQSFTENNSLQVQYDYISAYLDFSVGYPEFNKARSICEKYNTFPLIQWRELFEEISDQISEFDGKESFDDLESIIDEERKKKQLSKSAAYSEPKLSFTIDNKTLQILYSNMNSFTVKFYLIDLEILFSRTPFIKQNSDDFSFVQPNFNTTIKLDLSPKENFFSFPIPEEYLNSNLFIEVSSISRKSFETYFSTSLVINISETMGEVKVIDSELNSIPTAYVKCFAKFNDDSVKFYKDGYTDLRGKFNYVSLNTNQLKDIKKFSLFISHDTHGSTIKECNPPSNIEDFTGKDGNVQPLSEYDNYQKYRQNVKNIWRESKKK